jgi:hypothetical protein
LNAEESAYQLVIKLLGQYDELSRLDTLIRFVGEQPEVICRKNLSLYEFPNSGFHLIASPKYGFTNAAFFLRPHRMVRDGETKAYSGSLPNDVTPTDSKEQVQQKIGVKPFRSYYLSQKDEDYRYDLETARVTFWFNEDSQMTLMSVDRLPSDHE